MTALQPYSAVPVAYSKEWVDLVKQTVAKGATDIELQMFLYQCQKTGLDPISRQIYFQKRRTKNGDQMTILTGIDGYRLTAQRTGEYAGSDDGVYDSEENPRRATVTVYRIVKGIRCAFAATARWDQYYPGDAVGFMWKKMPHLMLAKCAEALALRKAFPQELSGIYTKDEMEQAGPVIESEAAEPVAIPRVSPIQVKFEQVPKNPVYTGTPEDMEALYGYLKKNGLPERYWSDLSIRLKNRPKTEADDLIELFKAEIEATKAAQ